MQKLHLKVSSDRCGVCGQMKQEEHGLEYRTVRHYSLSSAVI